MRLIVGILKIWDFGILGIGILGFWDLINYEL